jgi:6-pyruvoyltetrahydropterin/6-carboxytetrahydropterin synthase
MHELSQRFMFEAAHTLQREFETQSSRRVHGHTYYGELTVAGKPNPRTGMLVDLAQLRAAIEEVRDVLDHRLLDEVDGLGPPTLENLCSFIAQSVRGKIANLSMVRVWREASGDSCRLIVEHDVCSPALVRTGAKRARVIEETS